MAIPKINVWTYWEGPKPSYIDVWLRTLKESFQATVLTPEDIDNWLPPTYLNPQYKLLPQPALKADCIRAALLAKYGGMWMDADTIAWQSITDLALWYPTASAIYTVWDRMPLRVLNGYIYFQQDHPIAQQWLNAVNAALENDLEKIQWCSLGEGLLTPLLLSDPTATRVSRNTFLPIDIDSDVKTFFTEKDYSTYLTQETICFGLNHSWFMCHHAKDMLLPPEQWSKSRLLIHRLLRYVQDT